jgi:hypothetical protein
MYIYTFLLKMTSKNIALSSGDVLYIYPSVALQTSVGPWPVFFRYVN